MPESPTRPSSGEGSLRLREAARALVLSEDGGVLLVRFEFPSATRWALPGGGLEPGESPLEAIAREGESLRAAEVERAEALVAVQADEFRAGRTGEWPVAA